MGIQINGQTDTVTAIDGSLNVGGDVTIPGVLTYDDVTNVDSVGVITAQSDVVIADKIIHLGDTDTAIRFPSNNTFSVETGGSERLRVRSNGVVAIGTHESTTINYAAAQTQIFHTGDRLLSLMYGEANASGPQLNFAKGRDGDNSASTALSNNDLLGSLHFVGADGSDFNSVGAEILVNVDAAPGNNDMPGRIVFKTTASGESTSTERLRITSGGAVQITGVDDQDNLLVKGGTTHFAVHQDDTVGEVSLRAQDGSGSNNIKYMTFFTEGGSGTTERLRITSDGKLGIGTDNPGSKLTVYETGGNAKLQLQRANTANDTDDYGSILWRSVGGTAVGGINVARETGEDNGYMFFQTTESGSTMTERLRILGDGTIRKGTANSGNSKAPVELFFQKRSTQIGKRVHQGSGVNATTHDILNIDSWQSANSHAFIYVTVYYVSPVANYGGRLECYATAVNSGGNVSGGQGTFQIATGGRWGNPGLPSLSWSGSTLQFTTLAHAYIDYSLDITCIAYDGAVVSYYGN